MKNKLVIITSWALVVATMAIIFVFSSQNADSSSSLSQSVVVEILDIVMDKEDKIKNNRLALLKELKNKYIMLTDFSKLNV